MKDLLLLEGEEDAQRGRRVVVPVVGPGGSGKTTLARKVYNDPTITEHFPCRFWISVSIDYRLEELLQDIIDRLKRPTTPAAADDIIADGRNERRKMNLKDLVIETYKLLKTTPTRYLVVFDDVCTTQFWADINIVFPNNKRDGSRIIFTTRYHEVASHAARSPSGMPPFNLRRLTKEESWEFFSNRVGRTLDSNSNGGDHQWQAWVDACGGLPVTIITLAEEYHLLPPSLTDNKKDDQRREDESENADSWKEKKEDDERDSHEKASVNAYAALPFQIFGFLPQYPLPQYQKDNQRSEDESENADSCKEKKEDDERDPHEKASLNAHDAQPFQIFELLLQSLTDNKKDDHRRENERETLIAAKKKKEDDLFSMRIWKLIYKDLPHHLKVCLAYLNGLEEKKRYSFFDFKGLIVANGLVQPLSATIELEEDIAEQYLNELISRNMIKVRSRSFDGRIKEITISREFPFLELSGSDESTTKLNLEVQSLFKSSGASTLRELQYDWMDYMKEKSRDFGFADLEQLFHNLREADLEQVVQNLIWPRGSGKSLREADLVQILQNSTSLRVLDLRKLAFKCFPPRINLFHLRYLQLHFKDADSMGDRIPESLMKSDLWNLQFLKITFTFVPQLVRSTVMTVVNEDTLQGTRILMKFVNEDSLLRNPMLMTLVNKDGSQILRSDTPQQLRSMLMKLAKGFDPQRLWNMRMALVNEDRHDDGGDAGLMKSVQLLESILMDVLQLLRRTLVILVKMDRHDGGGGGEGSKNENDDDDGDGYANLIYYFAKMFFKEIGIEKQKHRSFRLQFSKMRQLRHLRLPGIIVDPGDGDDDTWIILKNLQTLEGLDAEFCEVNMLSMMPNLVRLRIRGKLFQFYDRIAHGFPVLKCLQKLKLDGDPHPVDSVGPCKLEIFPPNITHLTLKCTYIDVEYLILALQKLQNLCVLKLGFGSIWNTYLDFGSDVNEYRQLKFLELKNLFSLKNWKLSVGVLPSLQKLAVLNCRMLQDLPFEALEAIPTLQELVIDDGARKNVLAGAERFQKRAKMDRRKVVYSSEAKIFEQMIALL